MNQRITELAHQFAEVKKLHEAKSDELKALDTRWNEVELELMEAMSEEGVKSVKIEGIGSLSLSTKTHLSVSIDKKPGFFDYLREIEQHHILKLDVPSNTLSAWLKEHFEELVRKHEQNGLDIVDARNAALEHLKQRGASYFTKHQISHRAKE